MCYFVEKCVTIRLGDSMLPNKVIYKGKEFETIGFIKLNNGSFLILQNNEDIIYLDLSKINLKLDLKFEIKEATKVEIVLMDYIVEAIKNDIRNGKYQSKEDLKKDIVNLNKYINTHPELLNNMKQLDFKDDIVLKTITSLLSYFDETMKDAPLNLEGITSFIIDGKDYIKYRDQNGKVKIMDDNVDNRNFVEQFKAKQNESEYFKQDDGKESALNIADDMNEYQKTSIELNEVDKMEKTPSNQLLSTMAMQKYDDQANKDVIGNAQTGIYYDEQNDKVLTAKQQENSVEVSEVKEITHNENNNGTSIDNNSTLSTEINYPPYNEEIVTQYLMTNKFNDVNINAFIDRYLYDLSAEQIDYLLNNYNLADEYIDKLNNQKSEKNINSNEKQQQMEKPKVKVFTLNDQPKAAFVDTLLLSFIVGLVSGMYLIILILLIMS